MVGMLALIGPLLACHSSVPSAPTRKQRTRGTAGDLPMPVSARWRGRPTFTHMKCGSFLLPSWHRAIAGDRTSGALKLELAGKG